MLSGTRLHIARWIRIIRIRRRAQFKMATAAEARTIRCTRAGGDVGLEIKVNRARRVNVAVLPKRVYARNR